MQRTVATLTIIASIALLLAMVGCVSHSDGETRETPVEDDVFGAFLPHGALAIDQNQGGMWGWAYKFDTQDAADSRALAECGKRGGQCSVVMRFHNACAAYSADQAAGSTANGWAWTEKDRATAEVMARSECEKRGGTNCVIEVWGCT